VQEVRSIVMIRWKLLGP